MTSILWKELHDRALNYDITNKNDVVWLQQWSKKIPRFAKGCSCNEHWAKWYKLNPPNFTSVEKYFEWTVKAHNAVNERLSKPIISVEQAKLLYSKK